MGFSGGKTQSESGLEWVIAGIPLRAPLKPVYTIPVEKESSEDDDCSSSTTPTSSEARIPARLKPPPAPRKRKASLKCNYSSREFFITPPDLETVFIRHIEKAN